MRVIKVQGIDTIYDATTVAATDANISDMMVQIIGYHDVTRYWGAGEGGTVADGTNQGNITTFDFTNLPADSTAVPNTEPVKYRDVNGGDRKWRPCSYIVNKYDIVAEGTAE